MSGENGPILAIADDTIIILSGPFHGETITRDRHIYRQGLVYKPQA